MRRFWIVFISAIIFVPVFAATKMYLATEKIYAFTRENLVATVIEFINDDNKQDAFAKKWAELMDPDTGAVSVADMFAACRAGGLNTYRIDGYTTCRALIVRLLENAENEVDEDFLSGYCPPAYDEKGKQQNGLKSINEHTKIGDFCSSTNIYAGEVTFKKGYNCTCTAYSCNNGFEFKGGACVTIVADGQGNCLRTEHNITKKYKLEEAVAFCQNIATKNKCKYSSVILYPQGENKIICNPARDEVDAAKARVLGNKDAKIADMKYYEVCGQHKGKTGKKEYCIEDVFGDVDTGLNEAAGLSQIYAKEKYNKTVYCDTKYREKSNDDYMKCATLEKDAFFEFRFDDLSESNDDTKFSDTIMGLAAIYGYKSSSNVINGPCSAKLQNAAKKLGMRTSDWSNNRCSVWRGVQITSNKNLNSKLRSIDGLDCTIGKSIQTQGSTEVRNKLLSYIRAQGFVVTDFECDSGYGTVYNGAFSGSDDVLTCRVSGTFNGKRYNKQPVDFVFDDMSEGKKYQQKAGDQGLNCIAYNGNFDGHYCRKLTKEECFQLEKEMLAELKKRGKYTGDNDLVDWDESAGACELNDAQVANNINKVGKYTAIVGLTVAGAVTGGTSTAAAISLMAVELAGVAGEVYTERKKELLPQEWANDFLAASRKCNNSSCAESTLRSNFQKIAQASDKLNRDVLNQVDTELARLAEKLPDSRLQQIIDSSEPPSCWDTWECQGWIFTGMQFASLGVGVGKGLVKLTKTLSTKSASVMSRAGARAASHMDNLDDMLRMSPEEFSRRYSSRLGDYGIKEERTATGGFRYRDSNGRFISRENVARRMHGQPETPSGGAGNTSGNGGGGSSSSGSGGSGGGTTGGATGGASNGTPPGSGGTGSGPHNGNGGPSGNTGGSSASGGGNGAGHSGSTGSGNTGGSGSTGGSGGTGSGPHNGNGGPSGNTGGSSASGGGNGAGHSGSTGSGNTGGSGSTGGSGGTGSGPHDTGSTGGASGNNAGGGNSGPHNNGGGSTGNTGGTNGGANSGGNTGANGANSGNSGPHNTGNAGGAGHGPTGEGASGGGYHADLDSYLNTYKSNPTRAKRQLLNKYHPDKVAGYNDPELNRLTGDITQKINGGIENLSAAEKLELSRKMAEVDRRIEQAENAARSAREAEEAARRAGSANGANNGGSTSRSARNPNTNNGNTGNINNTGRYDVVPVNNNRAMVSGEATMPRTEPLMGSEVPRLGSGNTTEVPRLTAGSATEETRLLGAGSHADDAVVPKVEQVKETEIPRLGAGVANNSRKMTDDVVMDIYNEGGYIADPNYAYGSWERRWPGLLEYNGGEISNADNIRQIYSRVDAAERSFNKYKNVLKGDEGFERAYNVFLRDKDTLMDIADDLRRVMMK